MIRILGFCLLISLTFSSVSASNEKPQSKDISILASIKPIKLIVQAIVGDQQMVDVLVPPGMSIHDFALRPSDLIKIQDANLIVWLGPVWEPYLGKSLKQFGVKEKESKSLDVSTRSATTKQARENPHVWLSIERAAQIAIQVAERLALLHPAAGNLYRHNLADFQDKLAQLHAELKIKLAESNNSYMVDHDAYALFEAEFGLRHAGAISDHHEIKPGAKRLLHLRRIVESRGVRCIIVEPGTNLSMVNLVAQGSEVKYLELDPMAADADSYLAFIREVGEAFKQCAGDFAEK